MGVAWKSAAPPRAGEEPLAVFERLPGRDAGGRRGVLAVAVVVGPVVDADAADQLQHGQRRVHVLHEHAGQELLAAGDAGPEVDVVVEDVLDGLAGDPAGVAAGRDQVVAELAAPLEPAARRGRGHLLIERQRLRVAVGRLGRERAAELLVVGVERQPKLAGPRRRRAEPAAERAAAVGRAVVLERRPVAAVLVEVRAGDEQRGLRREHHLGPAVERGVARVGVDVDGAPARVLHDEVAVGLEVAALERDAERALHLVHQEVEVHGVLGAVAAVEVDRALGGPAREDVDDAAEGVVAPHARAAAADDLDLLDALQRDAVPVHPAAERVVDRDAVDQHEGAAGPARADAAEREALSGRVRHEARRAAEQAEAGHLSQEVVEGLARRQADVLAGQHRHVGRRLAGPLLGARHRDHDRLESRRVVGLLGRCLLHHRLRRRGLLPRRLRCRRRLRRSRLRWRLLGRRRLRRHRQDAQQAKEHRRESAPHGVGRACYTRAPILTSRGPATYRPAAAEFRADRFSTRCPKGGSPCCASR